MQLYTCPLGVHQAEPIQPQGIAAGDPVLRVERQEVLQGFLLSAIEHVTLKLGDDESKPRDLCWKVAQFDAAKIGHCAGC